jgi:hypothetical protein
MNLSLLTFILVILVALVAAKWYSEKNNQSLRMSLPSVSSTGGNWNNEQPTMYNGPGGYAPKTGSRLNVVPLN